MSEKKTKHLPGTRDGRIRDYEIRNRKTALEIAREGIVLLKNENVLPLRENAVIALYGSGARNTLKGGAGSGDVNERENVTVEQGLISAGFNIENTGWLDRYDRIREDARQEWRQAILSGMDENHSFVDMIFATPYETPEENLISKEELPQQAEVAIYVLSRISGEGSDRNCEKGDFLLSQSEKVNLRRLDRSGNDIILVLNTGGIVDLGITEELTHIKGIIYLTQAGMEGGTALAEIISGKTTPSGKLTDTWGASYDTWPSYDTFGKNDGNLNDEYYTEGIFVGYRWFDATGNRILYPFGHGLSYTRFRTSLMNIRSDGEKCMMNAEVTNIGGRYSGKEVVQLYIMFPRVDGVSREEKKLVGFSKTDILEPGESQLLDISFALSELGRFDEVGHRWMIDPGIYALAYGNTSEKLITAALLKVEKEYIGEPVHNILPIKKRLREFQCQPVEKEYYGNIPVINISRNPFTDAGKTSRDMCSDVFMAKAKDLAAQLDIEQQIRLVCGRIGGDAGAAGAASVTVPGGAGETVEFCEGGLNIPGLVMADGPAGLRLSQTYLVDSEGNICPQDIRDATEHGFFAVPKEKKTGFQEYYQYCTAFPIGTMVAQTWNISLAERMGEAVGAEMDMFGVALWLAPGMNIHRNPLCGRNFEYFSEDPLISGKFAAAITKGVQSHPGRGTTIKHFAGNNQEDNRMGVDDVISERALREIYLKGFQIAVTEARPKAIMTSYNQINGVHSSNSIDLCTHVARDEWGFDGIIMTDWTTTDNGSESWQCMEAGNDLIMPGTKRDYENIRRALEDGRLSAKKLSDCAARIIRLALEQ